MFSVSISHDGSLVAAGCGDNVIRIWNVQTGHLVERLRGHEDDVNSVSFTPDDRGLISGSGDKTIKRWDLTPFLRCDARMELLPPATVSTPLSASVLDPSVVTPVKESGERGSICTVTFSGHVHYVMGVAVSHDEQWMVSGSYDKSVLFWDARTAQAQISLHAQKGRLYSVDMSPTGELFATGDDDGITRICGLFKVLHEEHSVLTIYE